MTDPRDALSLPGASRASRALLGAVAAALVAAHPASAAATPPVERPPRDPAAYVDPLIGTSGGGNTFPGAMVPFGMVQWSPENTRGDATRRPAPGGYHFDATRIRGFSLTHLSGTGCRGASGDVPFLPHAGEVTSSPSADATDRIFASRFSHANEVATPGHYRVRLSSGVDVELAATARAGSGRFAFRAGAPAAVLIRASDSEVGSSEAAVRVDPAQRTVSGSVTSGNFCGYIHAVNRRSYYTLFFVAVFDRPFAASGTWVDQELRPDTTTASGGTTYGTDGYPAAGKGSGAYVTFDTSKGAEVNVRVGVSYVSLANAQANLERENPAGTSVATVKDAARASWNEWLGRLQVSGGTESQRRTFYTALYHSLMHPNLFSDVSGEYRGFDGKTHRVAGRQRAQYANFSGWDVYRSQLQLVTLLDPTVGSDIAQSLFNQATQNGGVWDRWTHNSGPTYVMTGDPAAASVASIVAFGGTDFDVRGAFESLAKAARVPTPLDLSNEGCPVECRGQRPSLDKWLAIHYIPTVSNSWGGAGETLEAASADFALAQLARRLDDQASHREFLARAQYWRNVFNPKAVAGRGYIQNRNEDGTWPPFDPAATTGFAEGSSAQYTWMVPFDARGVFEAMGGLSAANERLDGFFRHPDGSWALTGSGGLHAELDNEPSVGAPWLYLFSGRPDRTQETVRQAMNTLWSDRPYGIPGNDDLGSMSSWYVFAAMGLYPNYPGRAELLVGSPLFPSLTLRRPDGRTILIRAPRARTDAPFVHGLRVNGRPSTKPWLPESLLGASFRLDFVLSNKPSPIWGRAAEDAPPCFGGGG